MKKEKESAMKEAFPKKGLIRGGGRIMTNLEMGGRWGKGRS